MSDAPSHKGPRQAGASLLLLLVVGALLGCGSSATTTDSDAERDASQLAQADRSPLLTRAQCSSTTQDTLEQVAEHVYHEAAAGRILGEAVARLERSRALATAVERNDPRQARQILRALVESQIVQIRVLRGSHTLAQFGHTLALAPVRGLLHGLSGQPAGSFVLSVQGANGYAQTIRDYTGLQLLLRSGSHIVASTIPSAPGVVAIPSRGAFAYRGVHYRASSFDAQAFPAGTLRITLMRRSSPALKCAGSSADETVASTLGHVGMRIYAAERSGSRVAGILRYMERDRAFRSALFSANAVATRAAIVGFFRTHLHVVRVRASLGSQLVTDLGGPFVLAPVNGEIRRPGRPTARFLLAVQDDMGYMLLTHSFTGAQVLMRVGDRQVMGTLDPGPARIPNHGPITYDGVNYQAFSFPATAFPSGVLRISLLVPLEQAVGHTLDLGDRGKTGSDLLHAVVVQPAHPFAYSSRRDFID